MIAWWWSFLLAGIGVGGLFLTTREGNVRWAGYGVGLAVQFLWIAYALVTGQLGFLLSAGAYGTVNCIGLWKWWRNRREDDGEITYTSDGFNLSVPINGDPDAAWEFTERAVDAIRGNLRRPGSYPGVVFRPATAVQVIPGGRQVAHPNRMTIEIVGIDARGMRDLHSLLRQHTESHAMTYVPAQENR